MSNPYETAKPKKSSVLGSTLRFKGELSADEDLLIQGHIEGSIKHSSNLTIGEEGHVKADISAEFIAVEGKVTGDLSGSKSVVIRDSADIEGNIFSPVVTLLEGASFNGRIDMSGKKAAASKEEGKTGASAEEGKKTGAPAKPEATAADGSGRKDSASPAARKKPQAAEKKSASAA